MAEPTNGAKKRQGEAVLQYIASRFEYPSIRADRLRKRRGASWLGALTGIWGMLTGFAVFLTVESHLTHLPLLALELALAVLAAFMIDWLRATAAGPSHDSASWTGVVSTIVMIATFEVFILAVHSMAKEDWGEVASAIFGISRHGVSPDPLARGYWNLAAFTGLWVALAGLLAFLLASSIDDFPPDDRPRVHRGLLVGLKATLTVSLTVLAAGLVLRLSWAGWAYARTSVWPFSGENLWQYVLPLGFLGWLASAFLGKGALTAGSVVFGLLLIGRLGIGLGAWTDVTLSSVKIAVQTALVWGVPAATLGFFLPLLARPSDYRWLWGPLAIGVAVIAMALVLRPWAFVLGAVLIGAGIFLQRVERIERNGPLLAACAAMMAFAATSAVHRATGLGIYRNLNVLINPAPLPAASPETRADLRAALGTATPRARIAALRVLRAKAEARRNAGQTTEPADPPAPVRTARGEGQQGRGPTPGSTSRRLVEEGSVPGGKEDLGRPGSLIRTPGLATRSPLEQIVPLKGATEAAREAPWRQDLATYLDDQIAFEIAMLGYDPTPGRPAAPPHASHAGEAGPSPAGEPGGGQSVIDRAHRFELAATGSVTFWITMGLLAAWQRSRNGARQTTDTASA